MTMRGPYIPPGAPRTRRPRRRCTGRRSNQPHCASTSKPARSSSARHSGGESQARCIVDASVAPAHRERQRRSPSSQSARSKIPGSRSSQRPCVSRRPRARREDVEDEPTAGRQQLAGGAERAEAVGLGRHVQERAERDQDERDALRHGGVAHVAEAEIEQLSTPSARRVLAARPRASRPRRRRRSRGCRPWRSGTAIRPVPHAELDDRAAGRARLLDVELDVLGDARAPRVVDPRDRVVVTTGLRTTQTNSFAVSSNGCRSKPP